MYLVILDVLPSCKHHWKNMSDKMPKIWKIKFNKQIFWINKG